MAHHQKHHVETERRSSAMMNLLKMFNFANAPSVSTEEEEVVGEADEPPDDQLSPLHTQFPKESRYSKSITNISSNPRRESLLTQAILAESKSEETSPTSPSMPVNTMRVSSNTSSHSAGSISAAELTSDDNLTSPTRSATPSPPLPPGRYPLLASKPSNLPISQVVIAPITKDDKPAVADVNEAAVEKTLGRKRCIMFACGGKSPEKPAEIKQAAPPADPPKRKCMLTFACPSRQDSSKSKPLDSSHNISKQEHQAKPSIVTPEHKLNDNEEQQTDKPSVETPKVTSPTSPPAFMEFGSSHDETDAWVDQPQDNKRRLTLDDCMKKENAIRQLGEEAEEEAEAEAEEEEELDNELDDELDNEIEDDFAPSDDSSDGGNESDDEGGFADSDNESDAGSDYRFWAPSTTTAATSTENITMSHFSARQRSRASSLDSLAQSANTPPTKSKFTKPRPSKLLKMRPGTPELPDSTDFVCGTLDEDRPLEAAYIACREQRKRERHVLIPQDIDPSFPTTDPEDNDANEEEEEENHVSESADEPQWLKSHFPGFEEEARSSRKSSNNQTLPVMTPTPPHTEHPIVRPVLGRRPTNRSPPPLKRIAARSPPPRRLFGQSPTRLRSPPPRVRLRSPRGSPTDEHVPIGLAINRLAQRPRMERTASLPHTPNPFYRNFNVGSPSISNVASGAVTPAVEEPPRPDMHVRGPVDIVIGLEKKRQKRKEKFWRQHCRKAAKEQAERRPVPGRGAERMKELGLECAERTRGYGLNPQAQLVLSL